MGLAVGDFLANGILSAHEAFVVFSGNYAPCGIFCGV
jgi:hypothetical protein